MRHNILLIPCLTLLAINGLASAFIFYPVITQPWLRHELRHNDIIDTEVEDELKDQAKDFKDEYIEIFDKLCQK